MHASFFSFRILGAPSVSSEGEGSLIIGSISKTHNTTKITYNNNLDNHRHFKRETTITLESWALPVSSEGEGSPIIWLISNTNDTTKINYNNANLDSSVMAPASEEHFGGISTVLGAFSTVLGEVELELSHSFTPATIKAALLTAFLKRSNGEDFLKKFSGQGLFHAQFLPNKVICASRVYNSDLSLLSKNSLRSCRYSVGVRLKFWRRSRVPKNRSRDKASQLVTAPPSNLPRLYYNGSAAKSYSNTS